MDSQIKMRDGNMRSRKRGSRTWPAPTDRPPPSAPRGLAGVVVTDTELGDVRGREGFYHYRQYSAVELARSPHASRTSGT